MIGDLDDLSLESKLRCQAIIKMIGVGFAAPEWLAAQVVLYRVLNMEKQTALACMAELARRRESGDPFEFENYIEDQVKKLPVVKPLDVSQVNSLLSIRSITQMIVGKK